jgi:putative transposase
MARAPYSTDLTDAQWAQIESALPPRSPRGRPPKYDYREIVNAILYAARCGCPWRDLPHDLPPYRSVFGYFTAWQHDGTWERVHDVLLLKTRVHAGREPEPSVGVLDSQSVKVNAKGGLPYQKGGREPRLAATNISKSTVESGISWSIR